MLVNFFIVKKSPCGGGRAASPLVLRTRRLQSIFRRPRSAAFRSLRFAHALRMVVVEFYYSTLLQRRRAGNLAPVLRSHQGEGGCSTMHPPVATDHFERSSTGGAAHGARAFCLRKTKSDKINEFSILWDSCEKSLIFLPGCLQKTFQRIY